MVILAIALAITPLSIQGFSAHGLKLSTRTALAYGCSGGTQGATSGGCNNTDPLATGCNSGASTPVEADVYDQSHILIGLDEMRWSSGCGTNWTRGDNDVGCTIWVCITYWGSSIDWHSPSTGACLDWYVNGTSNSSDWWTNQERAPTMPVESYTYIQYDSYGDYYDGSGNVTNPGFGTLCV